MKKKKPKKLRRKTLTARERTIAVRRSKSRSRFDVTRWFTSLSVFTGIFLWQLVFREPSLLGWCGVGTGVFLIVATTVAMFFSTTDYDEILMELKQEGLYHNQRLIRWTEMSNCKYYRGTRRASIGVRNSHLQISLHDGGTVRIYDDSFDSDLGAFQIEIAIRIGVKSSLARSTI